jgi:hypothetical protein
VISEFGNAHTYSIKGQLDSDLLSHNFTFDHRKFIFTLDKKSWIIDSIFHPSATFPSCFYRLEVQGSGKTLTFTIKNLGYGLQRRGFNLSEVNSVTYRGRVDFSMRITTFIQ